MSGHDLDRARDALQYLDPGCSREDWHRIGRAAIAAGLSVDDLDAWSSSASNYKGEKDVRAAFRTIKPEGGTGPSSLFYLARAEGWSEPTKGNATGPRKGSARPVAARKARRLGMGAAEVWNRCKPAEAGHGYILAKQGIPNGLRVVPEGDPLTVAGQSMAGALVVPVVPLAGGEPASLQFIPPPGAGKKLNLPCAQVAGVFIVGDMLAGGTVFLCEGIGQAWACWKASGAAAVCCFGWGRVRAVAAELRQHDASARLVLVPDVGKETDARSIALEVGAAVAAMPEGWPVNADVNDLAQRDGADALEVLLSQASEPPQPEPRYRLLSADDLRELPPLAWCVRRVLPAVGLAALFGPSASGKSFLAFDLAAAIAGGWRWFDHRVTPAPVVYAALEGEAGFKLRALAWEVHRGRRLPDGLRLMLQPFKLTEPQDVADLAAVVPAGAVLFLDTLNRAAPTAEENSSRDMGEILEAAKRLQAATGGLVVLVHHTGKDSARGPRGHSSLFAAMDAALEVARDGDRREWKVSKSKDGQDGASHPFGLEVLVLGTDDHGDTITSCAVTAGERSASHAPRLTPAQRMARDTLASACEQSGELTRAGTLHGVHVEDWRAVFYAGATADTQDGKKRAFQRARGDLCGAGLATVEADFYRPTDPALHLRIVQAIRKRAAGQGGTTPGHVPPCPGTQRDNTLEGCPGVPVVPAGESDEA